MFVNRLLILCLLSGAYGRCQDSGADSPPATGRSWSVHFQATSIGQQHGSFPSLYQGENSLPPHPEHRVSLTATIFLNLRLTPRWEFVVNPEIAGGRGFGQVTGIAGFTNGEIPRVSTATPSLYPARAYVRYSVPAGDNSFTSTTGKFALTDFFDGNAYSHDPRTQFMNWAIMYNGAWDYPADTRGYTVGTMQEFKTRNWALRAAAALEPTAANGPTLDTRIAKNRGLVAEYEHDHTFAGRSGAFRVLAYQNREHALAFRSGVRRDGAKKYGFGLNAQQSLTSDLGAFVRYGWSDGKTESWAFTQIDRSLSGGLSIMGARWKRMQDVVGVGGARNFLSGDHRSFLAAGGMGFIIGDGRLNYAPERILEAYYAFRVSPSWTVTGDFQRVVNPAYNRDRGPVSVATLRLHWER